MDRGEPDSVLLLAPTRAPPLCEGVACPMDNAGCDAYRGAALGSCILPATLGDFAAGAIRDGDGPFSDRFGTGRSGGREFIVG